jgi:hypothetical protein
MTFIKQEVSDTAHNQRTRNFIKALQFGSIAQPSIDTKMEKMPSYTWSKAQQELRVTALKALRLHVYWQTVHAVSGPSCTSVRCHRVPERACKELTS